MKGRSQSGRLLLAAAAGPAAGPLSPHCPSTLGSLGEATVSPSTCLGSCTEKALGSFDKMLLAFFYPSYECWGQVTLTLLGQIRTLLSLFIMELLLRWREGHTFKETVKAVTGKKVQVSLVSSDSVHSQIIGILGNMGKVLRKWLNKVWIKEEAWKIKIARKGIPETVQSEKAKMRMRACHKNVVTGYQG